jgi:hypothetical protein
MRFLALSLMLAAIGATAAEPAMTALILDPDVSEISGMTRSQREDALFWAVNDSHNPNRIYALSDRGRVRAGYTVDGVPNTDWEDLTSYTKDGKSYLVIADTGDNGGLRQYIELIAIEEPHVAAGTYRGTVEPAWRMRIRWPDGPRDCEAVAIDAARGEVLLLSKKRVPAQLFRVPLEPTKGRETRLAQQIAVAGTIPQPDRHELQTHPQSGRYRAHVTSMALSPDGRTLVVLTYRELYRFDRGDTETWAAAFARAPKALGMPPLVQAESVTFAADGRSVYVTSEKLPAPLVRIGLD